MTKTTFSGPGVILVLDTSDPDTPAMVYDSNRDNLSATYHCALDMGELSGHPGTLQLSEMALNWLEKFESEVDRAYNEARKGLEEYQ
jgi:hypothetical protein